MFTHHRTHLYLIVALVAMLLGDFALAQQPDDNAMISNLVQNRAEIQRTVVEQADGVKTYTYSTNPVVAGWIQTHVTQMKARVAAGNLIHGFDPFFVSYFGHAQLLDFHYENVTDGVRVNETSTDPCGVALIHAHAAVVTRFIQFGSDEIQKEHDVPSPCPQVSPQVSAAPFSHMSSSVASVLMMSMVIFGHHGF